MYFIYALMHDAGQAPGGGRRVRVAFSHNWHWVSANTSNTYIDEAHSMAAEEALEMVSRSSPSG